MTEKSRTAFWGSRLDAVTTEIARKASIWQVRPLDPGVVEAVLHDNDSVCGHQNALAFKKLREWLMLHFMVREKAFDKLGAIEAYAVASEIRERLPERLGGRLGDAGSPA